jgi:hypothetical protein
VRLLFLLAPLLLQERGKDLLPKKCDAAVTEPADWCRTCDTAAAAGKHDGHDLFKALLCVRKSWTNG